jgi:hypothetical protein
VRRDPTARSVSAGRHGTVRGENVRDEPLAMRHIDKGREPSQTCRCEACGTNGTGFPSGKPCVLAVDRYDRERGGLGVSRWRLANPACVAAC